MSNVVWEQNKQIMKTMSIWPENDLSTENVKNIIKHPSKQSRETTSNTITATSSITKCLLLLDPSLWEKSEIQMVTLSFKSIKYLLLGNTMFPECRIKSLPGPASEYSWGRRRKWGQVSRLDTRIYATFSVSPATWGPDLEVSTLKVSPETCNQVTGKCDKFYLTPPQATRAIFFH